MQIMHLSTHCIVASTLLWQFAKALNENANYRSNKTFTEKNIVDKNTFFITFLEWSYCPNLNLAECPTFIRNPHRVAVSRNLGAYDKRDGAVIKIQTYDKKVIEI